MNSLIKINAVKSLRSVMVLNNCFSGRTPLNINNNTTGSIILFQNTKRTAYTLNLNSRDPVRYIRATRPKKTNDESTVLNYEQSQFAEKIGLTKSWNSWNTC